MHPSGQDAFSLKPLPTNFSLIMINNEEFNELTFFKNAY